MIQPTDILFDFDDYCKSCKDKNGYETEWQAKYAADIQHEKTGAVLSWYMCKYCDKWHLTSRTK